MVVFPFYQAWDRFHKFRVWNVVSSPVHCSLVWAFECWRLGVTPKRASLIASLVFSLAPNNIKNERVTRYFLILFDLDNVTCLDAPPIRDLKALVPLCEYKLLYRLRIHFFSRLFKVPVVNKVEEACSYEGGASDEDQVIGTFRVDSRDHVRAEV